MIRLLTDNRISDFSAFCEKRLTGAVIYTRFLAYGINSDEVLFWYGENEDGTLNGVFSLSDGIFIAEADENADRDEIELFAKTLGASQITYGDAAFTLKYSENKKSFRTEDITGENIKDAFDVVFEADADRKKYFGRWYTDASHKIRHGIIHGKCIYEDGRCAAVALTSGETESLAVISSVATLSEYRKRGFGEAVVISLAKALQKDVYLMTDNEKTKKWYLSIGFQEV